MLNSALGKIIETGEGAAVKTGRGLEGHAVFGPYVHLEPGSYVVVFKLQPDDNEARFIAERRCATVEVVSHFGNMTYACQDLYVGQLRSGRNMPSVTFDVHDADDFEFRVRVFGEVSLLVFDACEVFCLSERALRSERPIRGVPDLADGPLPTALVTHRSGFLDLYERGVDIEVTGTSIALSYQGIVADGTDGDLRRVARELWPRGANINVSYADAEEDVILLQALHDVSRDDGFYIDVGANDPEVISVTKLFYDRGWRGINIDPSPKWFARLANARPRDINIQAAVSNLSGEVTFYDHAQGGLGTLEKKFAERHLAELGIKTEPLRVKTRTLTDICEEHVTGSIHFLKIDVEGHEASVLQSMDFTRFRPWILCIEATEPLKVMAKTYSEWDMLVVHEGYTLARSDMLNRYYVANEQKALMKRFLKSPTGFIMA